MQVAAPTTSRLSEPTTSTNMATDALVHVLQSATCGGVNAYLCLTLRMAGISETISVRIYACTLACARICICMNKLAGKSVCRCAFGCNHAQNTYVHVGAHTHTCACMCTYDSARACTTTTDNWARHTDHAPMADALRSPASTGGAPGSCSPPLHVCRAHARPYDRGGSARRNAPRERRCSRHRQGSRDGSHVGASGEPGAAKGKRV